MNSSTQAITQGKLPSAISRGTLEDMVAQWLYTLGYIKDNQDVKVSLPLAIHHNNEDLVPIRVEVLKRREVKLRELNGT